MIECLRSTAPRPPRLVFVFVVVLFPITTKPSSFVDASYTPPCSHNCHHITDRLSRGPNLHSLVHAPRRHDINKFRSFITIPIHSVHSPHRSATVSTTRPRAAPGHARHKVPVCLDGLDAATRCELPYSDGLVIGTGEEELARWMEYECTDPIIVPGLRLASEEWIPCWV